MCNYCDDKSISRSDAHYSKGQKWNEMIDVGYYILLPTFIILDLLHMSVYIELIFRFIHQLDTLFAIVVVQ